ncbi:T9SS type A sorting domain-containing protein [Aquimarina aquimarini]|uniref:T9SS type A sorting domain-containing protein n=1 Tax=Aquimarina aquimarini TaxID=1191734 RepID=UPI000D555D10|nr:T9SS type A sorting domain-containing protein [Aquimarina aquimarini]
MKKIKQITVCVAIIFFTTFTVKGQSNPLPEGLPDSRISLTINNQQVYIPYWRNLKLGTRRTNITNAIIAFHGINQYGKSMYDNLKSAAKSEGQLSNTIIIAPIMMELDHINYHKLDKRTYAYWTSRWKFGDLSQNSNRVSSFTVIDEIIKILVRSNPNLKTLTVTGFSAGGQMINRYAGGGRAQYTISSGTKVQYVSYAPSIYLYPGRYRRVSGSETQFALPNTNCSNYNDYEFGVAGNLNSYMRATGASSIKSNMRNRTVYQMVGSKDTGTRFLDVRCGANLQGKNRYHRARIYTNYVRKYYMENDNKKLLVARGYGHSASAYKAGNVRKVFFPSRNKQLNSDIIVSNQFEDLKLFPNPVENFLHIKSFKEDSDLKYSIMNTTGELVKEGKYSSEPIPLHDLKSGMYFMQVRNDDKQVRKAKFIKQ